MSFDLNISDKTILTQNYLMTPISFNKKTSPFLNVYNEQHTVHCELKLGPQLILMQFIIVSQVNKTLSKYKKSIHFVVSC